MDWSLAFTLFVSLLVTYVSLLLVGSGGHWPNPHLSPSFWLSSTLSHCEEGRRAVSAWEAHLSMTHLLAPHYSQHPLPPAPGCAPVVLWPASTSAWCPQGRVGMGASGKGGSWVQHLAGYLLKTSLFYPRAQTQDLKPSKCLLNERRKVEESGDWKGPVFIE